MYSVRLMLYVSLAGRVNIYAMANLLETKAK